MSGARITFRPANIGEVDVGDVYELCFDVRSVRTGDLVDPDTVRVFVRSPSAVDTTYAFGADAVVSKDATGRYRFSPTLTEAGAWGLVVVVTGADSTGREPFNFTARATIADQAIPPS